LFAMHGLGTHGAQTDHTAEPLTGSAADPAGTAMSGADMHTESSAGTRSAATSPSTIQVPAHAVAAASSTVPAVTASLSIERAVAEHAADGIFDGLPATGGVRGLCFAVLTALIAWMLARGRAVPVIALAPRPSQVVASRGRGRDPDSPSLLVLSVHRC